MRFDSVKLRILHLGLLQDSGLVGSHSKISFKTSADRMTQLPSGTTPKALIVAGKAYHTIGEHELAVKALQQARDALAATGRSLPEDADRILMNSTAAKDQP